MPRDLNDLMERATASAPPELHDAGDITRLAAQRHRRRTTRLAAGVMVALVAVGALGYGVSRNGDSSPEPAAPYKYDQTVDVSSAVPASTLPGYHLEPWSIPSVQDYVGLQSGSQATRVPTYQQIDDAGRLLVVDSLRKSGRTGPYRIRLYDGPGQAAAPLKVPSPGTSAGSPVYWLPSFLGDGRLVWRPTPGQPNGHLATNPGFHITDLQGGHDVFVPSHATIGRGTPQDTPMAHTAWLVGDRIWFLGYTRGDAKTNSNVYALYTETLTGPTTKVADDVVIAQVSDGVVAWVTTHGTVVTESATTGPQHVVAPPFSRGCEVAPGYALQVASPLVVSPSLIGLTERCGKGTSGDDEVLAFTPSGRMVVRVTGLGVSTMSLSGRSLVFEGGRAGGTNREIYRYDLTTGGLARLGASREDGPDQAPQPAGDRVLWYDATGGHVGEFTD